MTQPRRNDRNDPKPWRVEGAPGGDGRGGTPNKRPVWLRFGWMLLLLLVVNWIVSSVLLAPEPRTPVSYTFFLTQVQAANVQTITSTADTIEGTFAKKVAYTPAGQTKSEQADRFTTQRPSFAHRKPPMTGLHCSCARACPLSCTLAHSPPSCPSGR